MRTCRGANPHRCSLVRAAVAGSRRSHSLGAFETAFSTTRSLAFRYRAPGGRTTRRLVEPHDLLVRPPVWYVIAWDCDRGAPRLFRADRISDPEVTDRTFVARPNELVTGVCPDARPSALSSPIADGTAFDGSSPIIG
ncbi:MAG: helix-turn-helix transcriptional regulator [Acidimicrobiales bacterium]